MAVGGQAVGLRQQLESQRLQRIAGEQGGRFAVADVAGGLAAAQGVVIHGRHIVVHQRVNVDAFDRRRRLLAGSLNALAQCGRRQHQQWAQAFAAVQNRITHRLMQAFRLL